MKLFVDSSTNYLYMAIVDEKNIKTYIRKGQNDHSENLVSSLTLFMEDNNIDINKISEIYVGRGPGSYTGLRIAGTVCKVLSYVKNLAFYSFSSLDLLLASVTDDGKYLACIKAKKDHSYYQVVEIFHQNKKVIVADTFSHDDQLQKYQSFKVISADDVFQTDLEKLALNIINRCEYQKENNMTYVPNYLRGSI